MKYMKRAKIYKASNVEFNPATKEAYSYDWWCFVKEIEGKIVYNDYNYSPSTRKHQHKVLALLDELGIKIDVTCFARGGLQVVDTLDFVAEINEQHAKWLVREKEINRLQKNKRARDLRAYKKKRALEAAALAEAEAARAPNVVLFSRWA